MKQILELFKCHKKPFKDFDRSYTEYIDFRSSIVTLFISIGLCTIEHRFFKCFLVVIDVIFLFGCTA